MATKILTADEINEMKKKRQNEKEKADQVKFDNYLEGLKKDFNKQRVKNSDQNKINILGFVDMDELKMYSNVLKKFENDIIEHGYFVKNVNRNKMFDSCPDPTLGYDIIIHKNGYTEEKKSCVIS